MKKIIFILVVLCSFVMSANAEVVILKNGKMLEGNISARTTQFIKIDIGLGVDLTYYFDQVDSIDGVKIKATDGIFVAINPEEEINENGDTLAVDMEDKSNKLINNVDVQKFPEKIEKDNLKISDNSTEINKNELIVENDKMNEYRKFERLRVFKKIFEFLSNAVKTSAFPTIILGIILAVFLLFWTLSCLPFLFIAKKLDISHRWMAFFPVLQLFLFIRLAGVPLWWIVLLFIPFVNFFIPLILWFKIAEALEKQTWLAFLMYVPLVNYFVLWYFALSKLKAKDINSY